MLYVGLAIATMMLSLTGIEFQFFFVDYPHIYALDMYVIFTPACGGGVPDFRVQLLENSSMDYFQPIKMVV